jgi:hypothetical protein
MTFYWDGKPLKVVRWDWVEWAALGLFSLGVASLILLAKSGVRW